MKPTIIVVEGKHDEAVLQEVFPGIQTISVGGSAVLNEAVTFLQSIEDKYQIIVFCDPDHAGEKIRQKLMQKLKHIEHAFLPQKKALAKYGKKIGVEHASAEDIRQALNHRLVESRIPSDLTYAFLVEVGLVGLSNSGMLRDKIIMHYKLGKVNAKTFYKRLVWLGVSKKDIVEVLHGS